jgi:hypothetical protein
MTTQSWRIKTGNDTTKKANRLFTLMILWCFISGIVFAQTNEPSQDSRLIYKTGDPSDWPKELDAVIAAPDNHKILLENGKVRVLEVTLLPGVVEPLHSHSWRSVFYIQAAGDFIDRDAEGNVIFDTRQLDAPLEFPLTMWKDPEAPHSVENLSKDITLRLIRVEIKHD